jgi:hypothetical protein
VNWTPGIRNVAMLIAALVAVALVAVVTYLALHGLSHLR